MAAGAVIKAHFVTRIRKASFSAYFDLGWDVATIHRPLMKCYGRRQVQRLVKEFKKNYSWEAPRPNKSVPKKKLCPLALSALSEMLEEDLTLYLRQLKCVSGRCAGLLACATKGGWCALRQVLRLLALLVHIYKY